MAKKQTRQPKCKTYTEQVEAIARQLEKAEEKDILDTVLFARQVRIQALALWDMLHAGMPDFIINTITEALEAMAQSQNLPSPDFADDETETREQAIEKIADILMIAGGYKPIGPDSPAVLALHLSAVIRHPLLPVEIGDALARGVGVLDECFDHCSPEYFTHALIAYTAENPKEARANG
jgi:hypothetical protein